MRRKKVEPEGPAGRALEELVDEVLAELASHRPEAGSRLARLEAGEGLGEEPGAEGQGGRP